jgi:hypothetical protein
MARKKQKGNGTGTVYPRKNKAGKVTEYCGSYLTPEGPDRTSNWFAPTGKADGLSRRY